MATDGNGTEEPNSGIGGFGFLNPDAGTGENPFGAIDPVVTGGSGEPSGGNDDFDPAIHRGREFRNADGSYQRKRGRRGSGSKPKASARSSRASNLEGIETVLVGIHAMLGAAVAPELALEKDESGPYAAAVANVAKHYDIPQIADKTLAWVGLIITMGQIYGPRAVLISERMKAEKAKDVTPHDREPGEGVITFPHFQPAG